MNRSSEPSHWSQIRRHDTGWRGSPPGATDGFIVNAKLCENGTLWDGTMSKHRTDQTLKPGTDRECYGCRVVYASSRAAVRSAVTERCGVALVDAALVAERPEALRWLVGMTTDTVIAVVGDVSKPVAALADVHLDAPVTTAAVEALVQRRDGRQAYLDAVERYFRALERGAARPELDAARAATDECVAALDAADRRAVLD